MARLLRHGAEDHEQQPKLHLADDGSIMAVDLLRHQTFDRTHMEKAKSLSISREEGGGRELRFGAEATHGGPKIRRDQGHTLPV